MPLRTVYMKNNTTHKIIVILNSILVVLLCVIVLNFSIHAVRTYNFNNRVHTLVDGATDGKVQVSGRMTGVWPKADAIVPGVTNGGTYEFTITDMANYDVANWTLRVNIVKECYLNQAWNGRVEIHQNVNSGDEKVDILDLHNFDIDYGSLNVEAKGEGKNHLMIHLYEGDYILYHPLNDNATHEYPLGGINNSATIGMIFYYDKFFPDLTYEITYNFGKSVFQGTEFVIFAILSFLWIVIFSAVVVWYVVRKKAERDLAERESMLEETMGLITSFVDAKDSYTKGHSNRVAEYTVLLAEKIGMHQREVRYSFYAAILHDVGKCYVPDEILKKNGRLTDDEFETIKKHTVYGGEMLKSIKTIAHISDGAKYHHERYDGKGYPEGLKGEEIPLIGRIICVADAFDAMTSSRCYRAALTKEYVIDELKNNMGKQFDPAVCRAMLDLIYEGKITIDHWNK